MIVGQKPKNHCSSDVCAFPWAWALRRANIGEQISAMDSHVFPDVATPDKIFVRWPVGEGFTAEFDVVSSLSIHADQAGNRRGA
jgi:hypothetical protein